MSRSSRTRHPFAIILAALALIATACEQPTELRPIEGVFVLRFVGLDPVPAVTGTALDVEFWALADTITLRADGSGEWLSISSRHYVGTGARDTSRTVKQFSHRRSESSLRATDITCEPMCEVLPDYATFFLDGSWLVYGTGSSAQRYERLPQ